MHVDYFSTVETIREVRFNLEMPAKQVMIRMINDTEQDEVFVATHFGHMSVNRFGYYKTFPIPIQYPLWLFMIEDLACVTYQNFSDGDLNGNKSGNFDSNRNINDAKISAAHTVNNDDKSHPDETRSIVNSGSVVCVNVKTRKALTCSDEIGKYFKSRFYTTSPQVKEQRAYVIESSIAHEFQVKEGCLAHVRDLKLPSDNAQKLWNSYDGSSLFLDDGYVLSESDFSVKGRLKESNSSQSWFKWISQLFTDEDLTGGDDHSRPIMALDLQDKVNVYSWPDLTFTKVYNIPIPKRKGARYVLSKSYDVHYCNRKSLAYVMTEYRDLNSGNIRLGVGYVLSV